MLFIVDYRGEDGRESFCRCWMEGAMSQECARCGAVPAPGSAFCRACQNEPTTAIPFPSSPRRTRSRPPTSAVPAPLWVAVGLLVAAGLYLLVPNLLNLPEEIRLLTVGGWQDDLLFLVLLVLELFFGAVCVYLAVRLVNADRVGRILTLAVAGSLCMGLLVANSGTNATAVAIVGSFAVLGILTMVEEVKAYFTGRHAKEPSGPVSVVAARWLLTVLGVVLFLTGLIFLLLGGTGVDYIVPVGIALILVSAEAELQAVGIRKGSDKARKLATGAMVVAIAALYILNLQVTPLYMLMGVAGAIMALLWIPEDARRHFSHSA